MIRGFLVRARESSTLRILTVFASANMIAMVLSGIGGILQARWVRPEVLGEFHKYGILTSYLALGLVIVQDGLCRQYPYLIGRGDTDGARKVASVAKTWYVIVAGISVLLFLVLSMNSLLRGDCRAAVGWGVQIIASVAASYGVFLQTIYRRSLEFRRLSYNGLISSLVGFASLLWVRFFGYFGLAVKTLSTVAIRLALDAKYIPVRIRMGWDQRCFLNLVKISVPLSIEGYIRTSFSTATFGYFVLKFCGQEDLGLFGVAAAFEGFAMVFVSSLTQFFDVKMANSFGRQNSLSESVKQLIRPTFFGFVVSIACAIVLCVLIGPFIRLMVPNYVGAIPIVYILSAELILGALLLPTRIMRVALMYKSIYFVTIVRVVSLVLGMLLVPRDIRWLASCKIISEVIAVGLGYFLLYSSILKEKE